MNPMGTPPINQPFYGAGLDAAIPRFFKKYAKFKGRASRSEFWWVIGMLVAVNIVLNIIQFFAGEDIALAIQWIWLLAIFTPFMALASRRAHDSNHAGSLGVMFVVSYYIVLALSTALTNVVTHMSDNSIAVSNLTDQEVAGVGLLAILIFIFVILTLIFFIFVCLNTDPRGVRFDEGVTPQMYAQMTQVPMYGAQQMPVQQMPAAAPYPYQPASPYGQQPQQPYPVANQPNIYSVGNAMPIQQVQPQQPVQPSQMAAPVTPTNAQTPMQEPSQALDQLSVNQFGPPQNPQNPLAQ